MKADITILDTHVHVHDCFDISDLLDHAYENFHKQVDSFHSSCGFVGVLLLTESSGARWFNELRQSVEETGNHKWANWRISLNDEGESITATSNSGNHLSIIAGRQIITAENLEVLALGLDAEMDDGLPVHDVIQNIQNAGALCVMPWAFGKWTGRRGEIVRSLVDRNLGRNFFIGDNAGRLAMWPRPALFKSASIKNIQILPGSDPLPFKSQVSSVGQYGSILNVGIDESRPFKEIRRILLDKDHAAIPYGSPARLMPFIKNQVSMQIRKYVA